MRTKLALALLTVALAGCRVVPQADAPPATALPPKPLPQPTPAAPTSALSAGLRAGPAFASLPVGRADASAALAGFRESCPRLLARTDASGLTSGSHWEPACTAVRGWTGEPGAFFERYFETVRVGEGT